MADALDYAIRRITELEKLLYVSVPDSTVWPREVALVFSQVEEAAQLPGHVQQRIRYHINRMLLERVPLTDITEAARGLAAAMRK